MAMVFKRHVTFCNSLSFTCFNYEILQPIYTGKSAFYFWNVKYYNGSLCCGNVCCHASFCAGTNIFYYFKNNSLIKLMVFTILI